MNVDGYPVPIVVAAGMSAPSVFLIGVTFQNNRAVGGGSVLINIASEGAGGGGGMGGAGGGLFVMTRANVTIQGGGFSTNSVVSGTGYIGGSAYGADIFLGADGGSLLLGQTAGINDAAGLTLSGGVLQTGTSLAETLGSLQITNVVPSPIDFLGTSSTLTFASLGLDAGSGLAILNYAGANDFLNIASGPVAVPEPGALVMAIGGMACGGWSLLRRKRAGRRSAVRSSCCTES